MLISQHLVYLVLGTSPSMHILSWIRVAIRVDQAQSVNTTHQHEAPDVQANHYPGRYYFSDLLQ